MLAKALLIGRIGATPELRQAKNGTAYCRLRVCSNHTWTSKDGTKQSDANWFSATAFGRTAENCAKYLDKGAQVYVEGRLQSDRPDEGGPERVEIIIEQIKFLSRSQKSERGGFEATEPSVMDIPPQREDEIPF